MLLIVLALVLAAVAILGWLLTPPGHEPVDWPEGKAFAFAIMDDTDGATFEQLRPFYDLLEELGLRATKTVWPLASAAEAGGADVGLSLGNPDYVDFVRDLRARGFEIAFHGARGGSALRGETEAALDRFRDVLGHDPGIYAAHSLNRDNLYWGEKRFSFGWSRLAYRWLSGRSTNFTGDEASAPEFWGDLARDRVRYVRNLQFGEIDTLRFNPTLPYSDPDRPYVNAWFSATEARNAAAFARLLTRENLDRLEASGGACLLYTHSAFGFVKNGEVVPEARRALEELAARDGWFVPVSEVLDHLAARQSAPAPERGWRERMFMDLRWFRERLGR